MRPANILDLLSDRSTAGAHVQLYVRKPRVCPSPKHQDKVRYFARLHIVVGLGRASGLKADLVDRI